MDEGHEFLTLHETAQLLRLSHSTIKRRVQDGDIKTTDVGRPGHPRHRVSRAFLDAYIEERTSA